MKRHFLIGLAGLLSLALPAPGPSAVTARAAEACATWSAQMLEDEGGPVMTAWVCAAERSDVQLLLNCASGTIWMR